MAVKDALMRIYAKHLAIGINWTEEELAESEFSCKVFEGFKKSAWMMYQIARDRINAPGWPLVLEGEEIDDQGYNAGFEFDGVTFNSVNAAIQYYSTQFTLDPQFFCRTGTPRRPSKIQLRPTTRPHPYCRRQRNETPSITRCRSRIRLVIERKIKRLFGRICTEAMERLQLNG